MTAKYSIQIGKNNPILRDISQEVDKIDSSLLDFAKDLISYMYKYDWVWLAAPQIGKNIRVIATTQWNVKDGKENQLSETIMINPVFLKKSQEMSVGEEACISLPDEIGDVKRHKSIHIEYLDLKGNKQKKKLKNFDAVIVQHEMDHLDGILFTDKLVNKKKS